MSLKRGLAASARRRPQLRFGSRVSINIEGNCSAIRQSAILTVLEPDDSSGTTPSKFI